MKKLNFYRTTEGCYCAIRIKRGFSKDFLIEKEEKGWAIYTKEKNGNWLNIKEFTSLPTAKLWLEKYMDKINMHDLAGLKKILRKK